MTEWTQPGDPEQLAKVVIAAERYYEQSRKAIIVYWDEQAKRFRISYASLFKDGLEVVRIPK